MEDTMNAVRERLASVLALVEKEPEPGVRLVLAGMVYEELRSLGSLLGAYGVRGHAAQELVKQYGSPKNAAAVVRDQLGVELTTSTITRLARR